MLMYYVTCFVIGAAILTLLIISFYYLIVRSFDVEPSSYIQLFMIYCLVLIALTLLCIVIGDIVLRYIK